MKFTPSVVALPNYRASKRKEASEQAKQTNLHRKYIERSELPERTQVKEALRHVHISMSAGGFGGERDHPSVLH